MIITDQHECHVSSQTGEDGIIQAILRVIGEGNRTFIEIGTGDGSECNCINLRRQYGWHGVLIDAASYNADVNQRFITAENVQQVLKELGAPVQPDVFSLDIDGNDWYVLANLGPYLPRLLVCEFNGHFRNNECLAIPYDPNWKYAGTRFYGGSQAAMHRLANELGFALVYSKHPNMFCVANHYKRFFENADDIKSICNSFYSHLDDERMHLMIDPFTVERPKAIS